VANFFADYNRHPSHSIGISREMAKKEGVAVDYLEADQELQDRVLSVHHAGILSLQGPAAKIIENNLGRTFARVVAMQQIPMVVQQGPTPPLSFA